MKQTFLLRKYLTGIILLTLFWVFANLYFFFHPRNITGSYVRDGNDNCLLSFTGTKVYITDECFVKDEDETEDKSIVIKYEVEGGLLYLLFSKQTTQVLKIFNRNHLITYNGVLHFHRKTFYDSILGGNLFHKEQISEEKEAKFEEYVSKLKELPEKDRFEIYEEQRTRLKRKGYNVEYGDEQIGYKAGIWMPGMAEIIILAIVVIPIIIVVIAVRKGRKALERKTEIKKMKEEPE